MSTTDLINRTTPKTKTCMHRAPNREYLFKVGPEDWNRRYVVKVNVARLMEQDATWSSNMRREHNGKVCECQYCNPE
jgi:hypothetical protein